MAETCSVLKKKRVNQKVCQDGWINLELLKITPAGRYNGNYVQWKISGLLQGRISGFA